MRQYYLIPVFLSLGIDVHTAMASVRFVRNRLVVWPVAVPVLVVASALSPVGA